LKHRRSHLDVLNFNIYAYRLCAGMSENDNNNNAAAAVVVVVLIIVAFVCC